MSKPKTQINTAPKAVSQVAKVPAYAGKFFASLNRNNSSIRSDRAADLTEGAKLQYKRKVEDLQQDINSLIRRREAALDLSPDTALSLKHASNFDPNKFVQDDIDMSIEIRNLTVQLTIISKRYKELFEDSVENDPDSNELDQILSVV